LGVLVIASLPPSTTSQAQPEPNWPTPAASNCSLKASNEPKALSIAAARSPEGAPPPLGLIDSQNSEWLRWPPPLLRTTPRLSSGMASRFATTSAIGLSSNSVPSSAPLALSTYAWWCLSWWSFIVASSMCGSRASYGYGRSGTE
jgi:hypothetical protein